MVFSAHSLQAYVDCQRRFELSYLEKLKWPAVESEPLLEGERHMADGRRFHEMVHRDTLRIPVSMPLREDEEDIARWWKNYQAHRPDSVPGERFVEQTLAGSISGSTLVATCDLIVIDGEGGRAAHLRLEDLAQAAFEAVASGTAANTGLSISAGEGWDGADGG